MMQEDREMPARADAGDLARVFHETYERLAPSFGYTTREDSAKPWDQVPKQNRDLMTAVCAQIVAALSRAPAVVSKVHDVGIIGPVNGMNEQDLSGSYLRLVATAKDGMRQEMLISVGAAAVLSAEIAGILDLGTPAVDAGDATKVDKTTLSAIIREAELWDLSESAKLRVQDLRHQLYKCAEIARSAYAPPRPRPRTGPK